MPQINITENSPNLSGAVQSQGSSHVSVFMCGASFMQKLTEGDSPVPAYKQYNSPSCIWNSSSFCINTYDTYVDRSFSIWVIL